MELREAIKVLDSDAHARISTRSSALSARPYRSQRARFIPSETYDRNLGGTLGLFGRQSRRTSGRHGYAAN